MPTRFGWISSASSRSPARFTSVNSCLRRLRPLLCAISPFAVDVCVSTANRCEHREDEHDFGDDRRSASIRCSACELSAHCAALRRRAIRRPGTGRRSRRTSRGFRMKALSPATGSSSADDDQLRQQHLAVGRVGEGAPRGNSTRPLNTPVVITVDDAEPAPASRSGRTRWPGTGSAPFRRDRSPASSASAASAAPARPTQRRRRQVHEVGQRSTRTCPRLSRRG